ncbi:MAG: dockerin type I repeat-containing protein, partial [Clostridia bacterium]|nr:dockerin type I repeat-containing protein [Clostridia bacterium]
KLRIGKTIKTHVKLIDENGNEIEGDFHFYTTTPDVVSVSENGDVTGLNGGTAYVYAAEYTTGQIVRLTVAVTLTTIIGDANIDDTINSLDILLVQQHILGYTELTGVAWHNCDIDGDLALDAIDLSMLQMMILGLA